MKFLRRALTALAALAILAPAAFSQPAPARNSGQDVRVVVRMLPPFVEKQGEKFTGFSVDLWNAIAARAGVTTKFQVAKDVQGQLAAVRSGGADVGVGAISITAERELKLDFSQPILNAGLQILVRSERAAPESTALQSLLQLLFSPAVLVWLSIAILLSIIPAHVVWFLERKHNDGIIGTDKYFPGIFRAFYWTLGALATQADSMPKQWIARIVALLWMFTGVVFVAFYTAQLTATLTVQQFKSEISGPADLPGKTVATISNSTSAAYLKANGVKTVETVTVDDAYKALTDKQVDAVVFDAPVLQYYAAHEGAGKVRAIGSVFHTEDYGFAFANGSDLRKKVNTALLAMREDGEYDRLREKWFGKP